MVDIETPTAALFDRLKAIDGIRYATRRLEDWDNVAPTDRPALMLTSGPVSEFTPNAQLTGQITPLWKVQCTAVLYVDTAEKEIAPSEVLNPLIAAALNALLKQAPEQVHPSARFVANGIGQSATTLGGLCAYCRAFGTIERLEGLIGGIGVAAIPIEMVLTS